MILKKKAFKPRPLGKGLGFVVDLLNINCTILSTKQFIESINIGDIIEREYSPREVRELLLALKYIIKSKDLVKNLYLVKLITRILEKLPCTFLKELKIGRGKHVLSWAYIFIALDECLLLVISFENEWTKNLKYKYELLLGVYREMFYKMQSIGILLEKFANEVVLSIGKLVIFHKTRFNFDKCKPNYTKTVNDIINQTFNWNYLKYNCLSVDCKKFKYLMTTIDFALVKYLILTYLQILKGLPHHNINRKNLLTFLLVFNDTELMQCYQSISWNALQA